MLNTALLHPEILKTLATSGHHSLVLIADGNYPAATKRGPHAHVVSLQVMPDVPTVAQVFQAILGTVQIDGVQTMGVDRGDAYASATPGDPPVWSTYRNLLRQEKNTCALEPIVKWDFYKAVESPDHIPVSYTHLTLPTKRIV